MVLLLVVTPSVEMIEIFGLTTCNPLIPSSSVETVELTEVYNFI